MQYAKPSKSLPSYDQPCNEGSYYSAYRSSWYSPVVQQSSSKREQAARQVFRFHQICVVSCHWHKTIYSQRPFQKAFHVAVGHSLMGSISTIQPSWKVYRVETSSTNSIQTESSDEKLKAAQFVTHSFKFIFRILVVRTIFAESTVITFPAYTHKAPSEASVNAFAIVSTWVV
jgi:hypothetical protein